MTLPVAPPTEMHGRHAHSTVTDAAAVAKQLPFRLSLFASGMPPELLSQFPVAEDFSRRSLALPFYPTLPESSVERVVAGLSEILGRGPA